MSQRQRRDGEAARGSGRGGQDMVNIVTVIVNIITIIPTIINVLLMTTIIVTSIMKFREGATSVCHKQTQPVPLSHPPLQPSWNTTAFTRRFSDHRFQELGDQTQEPRILAR